MMGGVYKFKFKFKFKSVYCISCKVFIISNSTINQILSIRTYYTTTRSLVILCWVCSSEMDACYLIMLIVMFTHNMYNTFKISVHFIKKKNKKKKNG